MESELKEKIEGEVRFDNVARAVYSVDASIYEVKPQGVAIPKSVDDLKRLVKWAAKKKIPLIPRGAATGTTGGCLGKGLVIDIAENLNRILEINPREGYVICEPGVVQNDLNKALAEYGFRLGPSTSTGNRATVGGMFANNAAGAHSLLYGQTGDHVLEVDLITADGSTATFKEISLNEWRNSSRSFEKKLLKIREQYFLEIHNNFPKIKRMVSGYNLLSLIDDHQFNPCRLLAGSEGTLGIVSRIKFKIVPKLEKTSLYVLHFDDLMSCFHAVQPLLNLNPIAIEMIDREIIESGKKSPTMRSRLGWLKGNPAAVLAVEFMHPCPQIDQIEAASHSLLTPEKSQDIWAVRKAGLELLLSKRSYRRAVAFIEDMAVPAKNLPAFMEEFLQYLEKHKRTAGIYGHVGESCLHIRPFINLNQPEDLKLMETMASEMAELVTRYDGAMSGEHGDGLVRSWLNKKIFTPDLYQALCAVKNAFDPENLMNPNKVVEGPSLIQNLRNSPEDKQIPLTTFQEFEGGFELAVDLCNGNGLCRKREGVMCPSFQATGREYDSTRARAQVLRSIIWGRLKPGSLDHPGVHDVLDLCLQCKGCKKECPSQVDMAKMKSEALCHYQKSHGIPLRSRFFSFIDSFNKWGSRFPWLANIIIRSFPFQVLGITTKRPLPTLATKRFSNWFAAYKQPDHLEKTVVLFNDTYCEFHEPEIGIAAVKVLNSLNYRVLVPPLSCCGRPAYSKGLLLKARAQSRKLVENLKPYADHPILFLEPSCLSMVIDDMPSLLPEAKDIAKVCQSLDSFLSKNPPPLQKIEFPVYFHGHCHQKSLWGTEESLSLLSKSNLEDINAGCCGLAGSFGYEAEHYDLSMKIGELNLFPKLRNSPEEAVIIANGFSCRSQIHHGTGKKAIHIVQLLERLL